MIARHLVVRGRVQGVLFRAFTREQAERHAVRGWAANRPDGSVEVWLEGEDAAVAAVERTLHEGPPAARVDAVEGEDARPLAVVGFDTR